MAELEANNGGYRVALGRTLVGVNMGKGFEHLNTPQSAAEAIEFNFRWQIREVSKQIEQRDITSEFDHQDINSGLYRSIDTAELEYHWLIGNRERVDWILGRSLNV